MYMKLNDELIEKTKGAGFTNLIDFIYNKIQIEDLDKIEAKYVDWYAEIRNYECNKILNRTQLEKLQKTNIGFISAF